MSNLFKTRRMARKLVIFTLAVGTIALPAVTSAAARDVDPRSYEAVVGQTMPQVPGSAVICDGRTALGTGDEGCTMTGGPAGGLGDRN